MMSPNPISEDRRSSNQDRLGIPLETVHVIGHFLRIWSVYSMYRYLSQTGTSVVPSIINGGITALYFILWGKSLRTCGPVRAILAEYSGAFLGVLSAVLYGRKGHVWKKVGGHISMSLSFYFLSRGWATASHSPISFKDSLVTEIQTEETFGLTQMIVPIIAGILSALSRVITRRVSLKNQLKKRLHAITISSATCFLFPVAMWDMILGSTSDSKINLPIFTWAHLSTILFGVILIF